MQRYSFDRKFADVFRRAGIDLENYLRNSDRPSDDIAFLLGYEDTSSFLRAFSTWTGQTITEYRQAGN